MPAVGEGVVGCSGGNLQEREGEKVAPQHDIVVGLKPEGKLTEGAITGGVGHDAVAL
jgi:hypothetical protein